MNSTSLLHISVITLFNDPDVVHICGTHILSKPQNTTPERKNEMHSIVSFDWTCLISREEQNEKRFVVFSLLFRSVFFIQSFMDMTIDKLAHSSSFCLVHRTEGTASPIPPPDPSLLAFHSFHSICPTIPRITPTKII